MPSADAIRFTVIGTPQPQGSTRAFIPKGWTRAIITSDNPKIKPWRQQISCCAGVEMGEMLPTDEAVRVCLHFYFNKPKSASKKVRHKTTKPDIDKCARAALDALTGVIFVDDSQVTDLYASKSFGLPERLEVAVEFTEELDRPKSPASAMETQQLCLPTP